MSEPVFTIKLNKDYIWNDKCNYSVSLITLNQLKLAELLDKIIKAGIYMLHIDILDGHFSPELPLGFRLVEDVIKKYQNKIFLDAHVMCDPPEFFVDKLIELDVDHINFHLETAPHIDGLLNKIKGHGIKAGVALKPATPISSLEYVIDKCDSVMVMLFNPGYSWSKTEQQVEYTHRKVEDLRKMIDDRGLDTKIIVDGRTDLSNIAKWGKSTVDQFVIGSTCLKQDNFDESLNILNKYRDEALS